MAFDFVVKRLTIGDVILLGETEATVTRDIVRTDGIVRVTLRPDGADEDVVEEWPVDTMVTVVRGP
jgi:hypothetical protein